MWNVNVGCNKLLAHTWPTVYARFLCKDRQGTTDQNYWTLGSVNFLHAVVLWQRLDNKMLDQRGAKRRDPGIFTCQMAAPLLLLSCHWATTGGSLEAETYAIQHAWSAVQLVAWKRSAEAKHRKWQNTCRHKFGVICLTLCTCMFEQLRS